jgi:16S rRNA (guanine966-N2)-methyltransferase
MRVIAGKYKKARLEVPKTGTRPTSDRIRESLFGKLENIIDFDGVNVLDLFAGSGALGIESLSRGASSAIFIDSARFAYNCIRENLQTVKATNAKLYRKNALSFVLSKPKTPFDLIFLDPPYDLPTEKLDRLLGLLKANQFVSQSGLVIIERSKHSDPVNASALGEKALELTYGSTIVSVFENRPE